MSAYPPQPLAPRRSASITFQAVLDLVQGRRHLVGRSEDDRGNAPLLGVQLDFGLLGVDRDLWQQAFGPVGKGLKELV